MHIDISTNNFFIITNLIKIYPGQQFYDILYWQVTHINNKNLLLNYYFRFMIKKFIKKLMERRKRNIKFRKEFYKKTGVDLNEIDDNVGGGQ